MPYQLCPHCGANREGMPDVKPCWRCGRLPTSAVGGARPVNDPHNTYGAEPVGQQSGGYTYRPPTLEQRLIPIWLWMTGLAGLALFCVVVGGGMFLFVTAEPDSEDEGDLSALASESTQNANATSNALPDIPTQVFAATAPSVSDDDSGSSGTPAAIGPFAETQNAIAAQTAQRELATTNAVVVPTSTATATMVITVATDLPRPTDPPTATPTPSVAPTDIVCPGTVLPQLVIGNQAEVVSANTIRMRDDAGLAGEVIVNIARGDRVSVTGDPICADGYLWWPITLPDGTAGWVAEGSNTEYFLEPR